MTALGEQGSILPCVGREGLGGTPAILSCLVSAEWGADLQKCPLCFPVPLPYLSTVDMHKTGKKNTDENSGFTSSKRHTDMCLRNKEHRKKWGGDRLFLELFLRAWKFTDCAACGTNFSKQLILENHLCWGESTELAQVNVCVHTGRSRQTGILPRAAMTNCLC